MQIANEAVTCPKCSSKWFEQVSVCKYQDNHIVILGQKVPAVANVVEYILLKCIRCSNLLEPRLGFRPADRTSKEYDSLLDTLEGKGDTREEKKT